MAREYGYRSWPALKAEVERRRLVQSAGKSPPPGGDEQGPAGVPGERWSFGGATAIKTSAGVLLPEAVVVGGGHATLYASLMPGNSQPSQGQAALGQIQGLVIDSGSHQVTHVLLQEGHVFGRKVVAIPIDGVTAVNQDDIQLNITRQQVKVLPSGCHRSPG